MISNAAPITLAPPPLALEHVNKPLPALEHLFLVIALAPLMFKYKNLSITPLIFVVLRVGIQLWG